MYVVVHPAVGRRLGGGGRREQREATENAQHPRASHFSCRTACILSFPQIKLRGRARGGDERRRTEKIKLTEKNPTANPPISGNHARGPQQQGPHPRYPATVPDLCPKWSKLHKVPSVVMYLRRCPNLSLSTLNHLWKRKFYLWVPLN